MQQQQQQQQPGSRLDTACGLGRPGVTCAAFIMYSWNFDLFWSSLQSYLAAGLGPKLIIIDNSAGRRIVNDAQASPTAAAPAPALLRFPPSLWDTSWSCCSAKSTMRSRSLPPLLGNSLCRRQVLHAQEDLHCPCSSRD